MNNPSRLAPMVFDAIRDFFYLILGILSLPFLLLAMIFGGPSLLSRFLAPSLSQPNYRDRINFEADLESPIQQGMQKAAGDINSLVERNDFVALARMLESWDKADPDTTLERLTRNAAIDLVCEALATETIGWDDCTSQALQIVPLDMIEHLENQMAMHPKHYVLKAICAQAWMNYGWAIRGGGYAYQVDDEGWHAMDKAFSRAAWLLDESDPVEAGSVMLAEVSYNQVGMLEDAEKQITKLYEDWSELDPISQVPHATYAFHLLPRWYGDYQQLDLEARRAAERTKDITGMVAYASFYNGSLPRDEYAMIYLDVDLYAEGVEDLIKLYDRDPSLVASTIQRIKEMAEYIPTQGLSQQIRQELEIKGLALEALAKDITRRHLTAIVPSAWEDGTDAALDTISEAVLDDLKAGATFTLGANGVEVHPVPTEAHA